MATVNLFYDAAFRDGAFTANDPRVRAFAVQKTMRAMDLGAELGARIFVLWGGREGTETDACRRPDEAVKRLREAVNYLCEYSIDRKYGFRFALEAKPNEPRGDIYMATTGAYLGFISTLAHPELVGLNPEVAHEHMAGLNFTHAVGQAWEAGKLFHIDLNDQAFGRYDQDFRFGAANPKSAFFLVKFLEDVGYDGPRHFDAHAYRTEDYDGVKAFARGCMRTYLILAEKATRWKADAEIQGLLAEVSRHQAPSLAKYSTATARRSSRRRSTARRSPPRASPTSSSISSRWRSCSASDDRDLFTTNFVNWRTLVCDCIRSRARSVRRARRRRRRGAAASCRRADLPALLAGRRRRRIREVRDRTRWRPGGHGQLSGERRGRRTSCAATPEQAFTLIPGRHRFNLHAFYGDFGGKLVDRDAVGPEHFSAWIDWAKRLGIGLDFNPTYFSHPKADDNFTLSHQDPAIRQFWIAHGIACRKIGEAMGRALGKPCVTNSWIPDGMKDTPVDRVGPRQRLTEALDEIFKPNRSIRRTTWTRSKASCSASAARAITVGSHEYYFGYALSRKKLFTLDTGHYHPTETITDKISSVFTFLPEILLHVSRGVRWDSDHVVVLNDDLEAIAQELVRGDYLGRTHIGLDYFDASINRVAAWVIGTATCSSRCSRRCSSQPPSCARSKRAATTPRASCFRKRSRPCRSAPCGIGTASQPACRADKRGSTRSSGTSGTCCRNDPSHRSKPLVNTELTEGHGDHGVRTVKR